MLRLKLIKMPSNLNESVFSWINWSKIYCWPICTHATQCQLPNSHTTTTTTTKKAEKNVTPNIKKAMWKINKNKCFIPWFLLLLLLFLFLAWAIIVDIFFFCFCFIFILDVVVEVLSKLAAHKTSFAFVCSSLPAAAASIVVAAAASGCLFWLKAETNWQCSKCRQAYTRSNRKQQHTIRNSNNDNDNDNNKQLLST